SESMNARDLPTTIPEYLAHLRRELAGADPALIQDALYDAEEYLRSELAENPGKSEAEVIAAVASSYGAPGEVADIYRDTEVKVRPGRWRTSPATPGSRCGRRCVRRARSSANRCWGASSALPPTRAPTPRCSTWCWRWPPASSTSSGWSPASRCRSVSRS